MDSEKKNPCDICGRKRTECEGCALDHFYSRQHVCWEGECFLNTECGCTLSLDDVCKASTAYVGDKQEED